MIKAIIIDDELRARRVLRSLIEQFCPDVEVVAECSNVPEAIKRINHLEPDVVFCDIEMPDFSGLELLSFFEEVNFELIFATGYSEYAIQAFEMSAIDYLLKPIQIEKLEVAVEKLKNKLHINTMTERFEALKSNLKTDELFKIAVPVSDGLLFIEINNLFLLEADGSYTQLWLKDGSKLLVSKNLRFFTELLENRVQFFRIHRSSLINVNSIKEYSKTDSAILLENNKTVKISRSKKIAFEAYLSEINLPSQL